MLSFLGICTILVLLLTDAIGIHGKPQQIKPGCRYEGRRYQEGTLVSTSEPCLQCRCTEGSLRCRLRVCPRLPSPSPPGCRVRPPRENVCCSELVCGESYEAENVLQHFGADINERIDDDGCSYEGVRYGPGSAMLGAQRCEYCYCISGARRCVKPKCLLPLPGCVPLYAPHSCCPVAYNCTHPDSSTTVPSMSANGCRVGERMYEEGEMVRDIERKATCDNCFCAMGAVRCVPLACAPPLQGCSPIVRKGQCCPSTYNCSGSIEVKATQNYASYAFISKDYAKFRKETNFLTTDDNVKTTLSNAIVEGRGYRVMDKTLNISGSDLPVTDLDVLLGDSSSIVGDLILYSTSTFETETMDNEIPSSEATIRPTTLDAATSTTSVVPTEITADTNSTPSDTSTSTKDYGSTTDYFSSTLNSIISTVDSTTIIDVSSYGTVTSTESTSTVLLSTTDRIVDSMDLTTVLVEDRVTESRITERSVPSTTRYSYSLTTNESTLVTDKEMTGKPKIERFPPQMQMASIKGPVTSLPTTILNMPDDIFVMNVTVKTNVSVGHIQGVTINPVRSIAPDVEAILNITHRRKGEDYDYDYSEPTLPPSLPNVRIIPFVAADALVKNDKDVSSPVTGYPSGSVGVAPELRPADSSGFYDIVTRENRFSPPIETEGGFVPREPPYFDTPYHSTDLNLEIGTGVTVLPAATVTNSHEKDDELGSNCLFESREYRHGELLPSSGLCIICICYYGEVVCADEKCSPLKIGCRRLNSEEVCCGKIVCVDTVESPTVVLDRVDASIPSQRQPITSIDGIVSPDPFRDVIKTEPAPDLPSLIEDMIPYLVERRITTPRPTTPMTTPTIKKHGQSFGANLQQNFKDFIGEIPLVHGQPYDYREDNGAALLGTSKSNYVFENEPTAPLKSYGSSQYPLKDPIKDLKHEVDPVFQLEFDAGNSGLVGYNNKPILTGTPEVPMTTQSFAGDYSMTFDNNTDALGIDSSKTNMVVAKESSTLTSIQSESKPSTMDTQENESSIFSIDSVFDLLFSATTTAKSKLANSSFSLSAIVDRPVVSTLETATTPTIAIAVEQASTVRPSSKPMKTTTSSAQMKVFENEVSTAVASLLKLAGCNIYGRMYRVGRIITELSSPCLECRCTEIGVQCKQLEC